MPCQFIASCFYLENPWGKSDTAAGIFSAKAAAVEAQPVINQEPQPAVAVAAEANIGPDQSTNVCVRTRTRPHACTRVRVHNLLG